MTLSQSTCAKGSGPSVHLCSYTYDISCFYKSEFIPCVDGVHYPLSRAVLVYTYLTVTHKMCRTAYYCVEVGLFICHLESLFKLSAVTTVHPQVDLCHQWQVQVGIVSTRYLDTNVPREVLD